MGGRGYLTTLPQPRPFMIRKKSLRKLPVLKRQAEKVFHAWICKRDNYECYTCFSKGNEAGHYWHNKLDFDPRNLHCQCVRCNRFLHGNLGQYAINLIDKFGREWFEKLRTDAHTTSNKFSRSELEEIIRQYTI
jgi:hypothetical protein